MAKFLHIQIPKGCEEGWDTMEKRQQGKFCNSCQKTVIDFTRMTDDQLVQFFKKREDNVCGRFTSDQLNTDIRIPAKRIPWVKYFFQITIPAFLFSSKVIAQGKVSVREHSQASQPFTKKAHKSLLSKTATRVPGIKFDESELAATILIKSEASRINGDEFSPAEPKTQCLSVVAGGVTSKVYIRKMEKFKSLIKNINKTFAIFPNPINSSSELNITWRDPVTANQTIEIYNEPGILLQKEIVTITKSSRQERFILKQLQPAVYFIRVTDNKTHKSSSRQFIVR